MGSAGTVVFILVDAVGVDPVGIKWQWWALGSFLLFLASVYWRILKQDSEISALKASPRPNPVFVCSSPATSIVSSIDRGVVQQKAAHFARAEFRNQRRPSPVTISLERPHVTIKYYDVARTLIAQVRDGRIAESRERYEPVFRGGTALIASEARLNEIRVGETFTIDLLVRLDDQLPAHTWSSDSSTIGPESLQPGSYKIEVEIEADNITETYRESLIVTIPDEKAVEIPVARLPQ